MASHAGLVMVLKTKKGYITEDGTLTDDIEKARRIYGLEFGFLGAFSAAQQLGFQDDELEECDYDFHTLEPSFDSRLGAIEGYLRELGMDYYSALERANLIFVSHRLNIFSNYQKYIDRLEQEVIKEYMKREIDEEIEFDSKKINLYKIKDGGYEKTEYKAETFYSEMGKINKFTFYLKNPNLEKYFGFSDNIDGLNRWQNEGIVSFLSSQIETESVLKIRVTGDLLEIYTVEEYFFELINTVLEGIQRYYSERELHVTRMFGSYILLKREKDGLKAALATPIPIKYCPLMVDLLKEVGGSCAEHLLESLDTDNPEEQVKLLCELINEVVIKGGYFDTNRPLNSCEVNVLFGASETISSAFKSHMLDAAVIVSNNLGTIITTNDTSTQGAVKRMTGLFYTSPSENIVKTAEQEGIIPVFPYTAKIDQLAGVKYAIRKGYKRIAVSVAAGDNYLHRQLSQLEQEMEGVTIYKFGLCSTGIDKETAIIMRDYADIVWSCASKQVKDYIEPSSLAQVGIKIPVHVMTERGFQLVHNHLTYMDGEADIDIPLLSGEEKRVILNSNQKIKVLKKKDVHDCQDCPHPCI